MFKQDFYFLPNKLQHMTIYVKISVLTLTKNEKVVRNLVKFWDSASLCYLCQFKTCVLLGEIRQLCKDVLFFIRHKLFIFPEPNVLTSISNCVVSLWQAVFLFQTSETPLKIENKFIVNFKSQILYSDETL